MDVGSIDNLEHGRLIRQMSIYISKWSCILKCIYVSSVTIFTTIKNIDSRLNLLSLLMNGCKLSRYQEFALSEVPQIYLTWQSTKTTPNKVGDDV